MNPVDRNTRIENFLSTTAYQQTDRDREIRDLREIQKGIRSGDCPRRRGPQPDWKGGSKLAALQGTEQNLNALTALLDRAIGATGDHDDHDGHGDHAWHDEHGHHDPESF